MINLPAEVVSNMPVGWEDLFDADLIADDLSAGAGGTGFGVISIRGSKFRVKSGNEEHPIVDVDGNPVPSIEVVILKANPHVSKIWYDKKYAEGDDAAPDCFSVDGLVPDPSSVNKQSAQCATCPKSQWGSRITDAGVKAKACSDSRRLAVWVRTPLPDGVNNDEPMMLRVPAVSLADLATYGKNMASKNAPYNRIVTRIGFDINVSFPKLTYKAVSPLGDAELPFVAGLIQHEKTTAILSVAETIIAAAPVTAEKPNLSVDTEFEVPAAETKPEPVVKKPAAKKPVAKKQVEAEKPAPKVSTALDDDLDSIIAELDNL